MKISELVAMLIIIGEAHGDLQVASDCDPGYPILGVELDEEKGAVYVTGQYRDF